MLVKLFSFLPVIMFICLGSALGYSNTTYAAGSGDEGDDESDYVFVPLEMPQIESAADPVVAVSVNCLCGRPRKTISRLSHNSFASRTAARNLYPLDGDPENANIN